MLVRMAVKGHPPIDTFREEVEKLFVMNKRHSAPEFTDRQRMAWRLRFLVCFVKMKARRSVKRPDSARERSIHSGYILEKVPK